MEQSEHLLAVAGVSCGRCQLWQVEQVWWFSEEAGYYVSACNVTFLRQNVISSACLHINENIFVNNKSNNNYFPNILGDDVISAGGFYDEV